MISISQQGKAAEQTGDTVHVSGAPRSRNAQAACSTSKLMTQRKRLDYVLPVVAGRGRGQGTQASATTPVTTRRRQRSGAILPTCRPAT